MMAANWLIAVLQVLIALDLSVVSGQQQWTGFINRFRSQLDFTCPNNSVLIGVASDFSASALDRQWEFLCGTDGGRTSVNSTSCSLQPAINVAQADIGFSCPRGGYLAGFRSEYQASRFDREWEPYCCTRPASALINCQTPTTRYENDLRDNLNFTAPNERIIVGVESFYFNRDRRWRYETCQIEVSCGDPGTPANARRIGSSFLYRDEVRFECEDGYYQSSGAVGGVRECLITGEWSNTQPVCSQCEEIEACEQVLCTNTTDHFCMLCESNRGMLPGQRAYTNLGTECEARCSWLGAFCYPGVCPDTPESCSCVAGFEGQDCLQISTSPSLLTCSLLLEDADGDELSAECLPSNQTLSFFTNISPSLLRGVWQGLFVGPMSPPPSPAYISGYEVGLATSEMVASIYRAANPSDVVSESVHRCDVAPPSPDQPMPGLTSCTASATPPALANHTFLHGDMFDVEVRLVAGGFLDVTNLDTGLVARHYYTGTPTIGEVTYVLDFQPPTHCSLLVPACSDPDQPLLAVSGEIVSNGSVWATWGGWVDQPAGVSGYTLSLYHLEESEEMQLEGELVLTISYNETGDVYEQDIQLPLEGPYSIILQAMDHASNVRLARRLILFDATSTLNIDPLIPLSVISAVPNTLWQNSTQDPILISGRGHFFNSHLRSRDLLAPVGDGFNGSLSSAYDHPLNEGAFPRGGTLNALGVVRLEYDVVVDQLGGMSDESLTLPESFRYSSEELSLEVINISVALRDGDSVRVWFLATDYNMRQVNDSVLLHVDSSGPELSGLGLVRHGQGALSLHGQEALTDLLVEFDVQDPHSSVLSVEWILGTGPELADVGSGNVPVQSRAPENCTGMECVCNSVGTCSLVHYSFSPQLSDLLVSQLANHDAEYYITVTATNHALLSTDLSLAFTVDATPPLPGAVFDGEGDVDVDYSSEAVLSGWWRGFFDRETDVMFYQYTFANACADISAFSYPLPPDSVVMETDAEMATVQAPGVGTYFLTVVAWNSALSPSVPVCSDGLTLDITPPWFGGVVIPGSVVEGGLAQDASGVVWWVGPDRGREMVRGGGESTECTTRATSISDLSAYPIKMLGSSPATVSSDICLTSSALSLTPLTLLPQDHTLNISWLASDNVGLREFYVGVGNSSDASTQRESSSTGHTHYSITSPELLQHGAEFYITVRAEDLALHSTSITLGPILVHIYPPLVNGSLQVSEVQGHVIVTWNESTFMEEEGAGPLSLQYAIGLSRYSDEVLSFRPFPLDTPSLCPHSYCIAIDPTSQATPLISGRSYAFTISATNKAGLSAFLTSDPYLYASASPTSGLVLDFDPSADVEIVAGSSYHLSDIDILLEGVALGVRWAGFAHSSADVSYSVSLGLTPGAGDIVPLTPLGPGVDSYVFYNASLREGSTHYATVVADTGFSSSVASSNGVWVFRGGMAALRHASVYDGASEVDMEYQASLSHVSAQWFFPSIIHTSISHYMWAVFGEEAEQEVGVASGSGSGSVSPAPEGMVLVREYQNVGRDAAGVGVVSDTGLRSGRVYVNAVRACFATSCLPAVYSDGFRVSTPPTPTSINATYIPFDLDQVYGTSSSGWLELEWEEFADPQLVYYEWSLGEEVGGGALLLPWRRVEWFENRVSVVLNVSVSLHRENVLTLRGYNSAGLYGSISTQLLWSVGDSVLPQSQVPLTPLVVYDIPQEQVTSDPSLVSWRDISYRVTEVRDIDYSTSPASLSGAWPSLRYTQYNYSVSTQQAYVSCEMGGALACGSTHLNSATLSNLALSEGERYYFCLHALREHAIHYTTATPPALEACSNGITIDTTSPRGVCVKVVSPSFNGAGHMTGSGGGGGARGELTPDVDMRCDSVKETRVQVSTSELYVVWEEFVDVEEAGKAVHASGVAYYQYAIGKNPLGSDVINFTSVGVATYAVARGLSLQSGLTYYVTVRATDFTGSSGYTVSLGVRIDTTKPSVEWVGLMGITSFQTSLQLEWTGIADEESDVTGMEWSLGTRPGSSDVTGWREVDVELNTGLTINTTQLNLYQGEIIFASLKVGNGAGLWGVTSSPAYTLDSSPPEVGVVYDGAPPTSPEGWGDVEYWTEAGVVMAHWRGFSDPHTDIAEYWWAIGTCQGCTDVQPFISVGKQQAGSRSDLLLAAGLSYYVTVRACNPLGLCSQTSSDGALFDVTPPTRGRVLDGLVGGDLQYQASPSLVSGHWEGFHDAQSLIRNYVYYAGLSPNGSDLIPPTSVPAHQTSFLHPLPSPLPSGTQVYSTVVAYNRAGLYTTSSSNGVTIDSSAPVSVSNPLIDTEWVGSRFNSSQLSGSALRIAWNFTDNLHSVYRYFVSVTSDSRSRLGTAPQALLTADSLSLSSPQLSLADGKTYQVSVRGCDLAGICSSASSSLPVLVDASPPIGGYFAVSSESVANLTSTRVVPGGMTWRNRPVRGVAQLNLAFLGFSDPHSGIAQYWASVGTTLSSSDLLEPTLLTVSLAANDSLEVYLALVSLNRLVSVSETLYISLWAVNSVGLSSPVVQASFRVEAGTRPINGSLSLLRWPECGVESCLGHCTCGARGRLCNTQSSLFPPCAPPLPLSSLPPDRVVYVYNTAPQLSTGATPEGPLFTSITDQLHGRWELADPTSNDILRLEWSVGIRDDPLGPGAGLIDVSEGEVWRESGGMSAVFHVSESHPLLDGEVYVFYVRAWYSTLEYAVFSSEGVVVDSIGPVSVTGGRVREGRGRDLDFTPSSSSLVIAWDGIFSTFLSGNYSEFELGVGDMPGSDNTYSLTSVPARQLLAQLSDLTLEEGVAYYTMVRATNELGVSSTSISDGVLVDMSPPDVGLVLGGRGLGYAGSRGQTDTETFAVRWYGFHDAGVGVDHYEVAVTDSPSPPSTPDLYQHSSVALQTRVLQTLMLGQTYYAHVSAVNRAGLRSIATSEGVAVQESRPEGRVCQVRGAELLVNPSFENDTASGVPCPPQPLSITMATASWDLNTTYVRVASYPETTPPHGCLAVSFMGSISQHVSTLPGDTHLLTFSYRYQPLPQHAAVRVQLPGIDRLIFRPPGNAMSWNRARVEFIPEEAESLVTLSSALSDSPIYIDDVSVTQCDQNQTLISTDLSVTWPAVIRLNHQVISSSRLVLTGTWGVEDALSGVRTYWWAIGTVPGGEQLQAYTSTGPNAGGTSQELSVADGEEVHVTVVTWNHAGRELVVHSGPYLVDLTPPIAGVGTVLDGTGEVDVDYQSSPVVSVNWRGLMDSESGLAQCSWAIGTSPGLSDVQQFLPIPILMPDNTTASSDLSPSLQHGVRVYSTVTCSNRGGLTSTAYSDGVTILYEPPSSDNASLSISSPIFTAYAPLQGYMPSPDTTLRWDGFAESAGTALAYEVRVLEEGPVGLGNWTSVSSAKMLTLRDLDLAENATTHNIEIRAVNLGGVVSDPIRASFAIISTSPEDTGVPINASWSGDNSLTLDWSDKFISLAPLYFEFSFGTQMGSGCVRKWVELDIMETSYSVSGALLQRNEDYFASVTAITSSGLHSTTTQLFAGLPVGM